MRNISILVVIGTALVLRAALPLYVWITVGDPSVFHEIYTPEFLQPALELVKWGTYSIGGRPDIAQPPGYAAFLVPGLLMGNVELWAITVQVILGCATVYLVYRLGALVFGSTGVGIAAALLLALDPLSIAFCSYLLPETLHTFLVVCFLFGFVRYLKLERTGDLVLAAAFMCAAAYVKILSYFLPFAVNLVLIVWIARNPKRRLVAHFALFTTIWVTVMGAWQVRNYALTGYGGFSTIFATTLHDRHAPALLKAVNPGESGEQALRDYREDRIRHEQLNADIDERIAYRLDSATEVLLEHPFTYTWIHVKGTIRTLTGLGAHGYVRILRLFEGTEEEWQERIQGAGLLSLVRQGPSSVGPGVYTATVLLAVLLAIYYLLAAVGLCTRSFWSHRQALVLLGFALYYLVITGGPPGYSRYRHVLMPTVCLVAGFGAQRVRRGFRKASAANGWRNGREEEDPNNGNRV